MAQLFQVQMSGEALKARYVKALTQTANHLSKAAKMVGHSRPTFLKNARAFGLWPRTRNKKKVWEHKRAA